ncbi:uncharacterized protein LOC127704257 [Mytilus californianus]|uniref:uncharacterized protein LOC127704257 n=1 Tax=Mytilus californianus TaxID=6549 RepID=UPI00224741DA|nr:uncharacterized protein LOC127704257 [Mytilus californianus]
MRRFSFLGNVFGNRRTSITSTSNLTPRQTPESPEIDYPFSDDDDEDCNGRGHRFSDASGKFRNDDFNEKQAKRTNVEINVRQNNSGNVHNLRKQLEEQKGLHEPHSRTSKKSLLGNRKALDNKKSKVTRSEETYTLDQDYLEEPKRNKVDIAHRGPDRHTKPIAKQGLITDSESDDEIRKKIAIALNERTLNKQKDSYKRKRNSKNVKIELNDRDDLSVSSKDGYIHANWLYRKQATNNGVLLQVSLDDMKSLLTNNQTRKQNLKEDYLTSDTDTINTSSNNSGVALLPHVKKKKKDITTSKRFLPSDMTERNSMASTDMYLSVGSYDAERFLTSNRRMSTTEKMNAYLLSQARSISGNYRPTKEYTDEFDGYDANKNIANQRRHFGTDGRHNGIELDDCCFAHGLLCDSRCSDNLYKDHHSSLNHCNNSSCKNCGTCNNSSCKNSGTNIFPNIISNHSGFTNNPVYNKNLPTTGTHYLPSNNYVNQHFHSQNASSQHFPVTTHGNSMPAPIQGLSHNVAQVPALLYNFSTVPGLSQNNTPVAGLPQNVFPSTVLSQNIHQMTQPVHSAIGQIVQQPNDPTKTDCSSRITIEQPNVDKEDTNKENTENKGLPSTTDPKNTHSKKEQQMQNVGKLRPLSLILTILAGLCGFGVIGVGVWSMIDEDITMYTEVIQEKDNQNFLYFCYGLCFLGTLSTVAFLFGFCGLLKLNPCCLKVHWSAEIGGAALIVAIVALIYLNLDNLYNIPVLTLVTGKVETNLAKFLKESLMNNYLDGSPTALSWNRLQIEKSCCGIKGKEDYAYSAWTNNSRTFPKKKFPNSCCVVKEKNYVDPQPTNTMLCHLQTSGFYHQKGCLEMVMIWYKENSLITLGVLGGLFLVEIACFLLAFKISRSIVLDRT